MRYTELYNLQKKAFSLQDIFSASTTLLLLSLAVSGGIGFGAGYGLGKITGPRKTDLDKLTKQYQLAKVNKDIKNQQTALANQIELYKQNKPEKKTVYGIV